VLRLEFTRSGHIVFEKLTVPKRNNQNLGKRKIGKKNKWTAAKRKFVDDEKKIGKLENAIQGGK
jgi:hypothetical protein